jgi:hypothetical protein
MFDEERWMAGKNFESGKGIRKYRVVEGRKKFGN